MPLGLRIALRHLVGRKRQTVMSLLGIALGVAFFMAVSALMRGSERDFVARLIDAAPHVTVSDEFRVPAGQPARQAYAEGAVEIRGLKPRTDERGIRGYKQALAFVEELPGVRVAPALTGEAVLGFAGRQQGVRLNGVEPERLAGVSDIDDKMVEGSLDALAANPNGIIVGRALAERFFLGLGDNLSVAAPTGLVRTMKIVGLFHTGTTAVDEGQAYVLLKRAQTLLGRPDRANRLILQMDDPYGARELAALIETRVGYKAESWQEASENVLTVLLIRNVIMYSVVAAILVVASFGIYNVISTVVMEKRRDIAILKSMGFHARDVRRIFLAEGTIIGGLGSLSGIGLGHALMAALSEVTLQPPGIGEEITLPIYWGLDQTALGIAFALASAAGAAYLPARKAGRVHPVDILRGGAG